MLGNIKTRIANMGTIKALCVQAESHALRDQRREPGAEDFLLAAFDLPDGTAQRAFERVGADPGAFRQAIERQYADALRAIGLDPGPAGDATVAEPLPARPGVYDAAASGKQVMQELAASRKDHTPLLGAHVVAVVAGIEHGVAARALRVMGIDREALNAAAQAIARTAT